MAIQCIKQTINSILTPICLHSSYNIQFVKYYHQYGYTVHTENNSNSINTNIATQFIQKTFLLILTRIWLHSAYSKQFIYY